MPITGTKRKIRRNRWRHKLSKRGPYLILTIDPSSFTKAFTGVQATFKRFEGTLDELSQATKKATKQLNLAIQYQTLQHFGLAPDLEELQAQKDPADVDRDISNQERRLHELTETLDKEYWENNHKMYTMLEEKSKPDKDYFKTQDELYKKLLKNSKKKITHLSGPS